MATAGEPNAKSWRASPRPRLCTLSAFHGGTWRARIPRSYASMLFKWRIMRPRGSPQRETPPPLGSSEEDPRRDPHATGDVRACALEPGATQNSPALQHVRTEPCSLRDFGQRGLAPGDSRLVSPARRNRPPRSFKRRRRDRVRTSVSRMLRFRPGTHSHLGFTPPHAAA